MSYDNYKLSNPNDDGYYSEEVSNCCGAKVLEMVCSQCGDDCEEIDAHEYAEKMSEYFKELNNDW
tara:strand:+ start:1293 stop:1487 length:195 start_codon:yes stop_codon:yes gene_type:complete